MFAARQALLARLAPLAVAFLMVAALSGCGGDTNPGEEAPKRALDPRSEALRYFPASTEAVTLVETSDAGALTALDEGMGRSPGWDEARDRVTYSLRRAGIEPERILELGRRPAVEIDLPQPEIAFGTVPGAGPPRDRLLMVLPTEQGIELDRIFRRAAERGDLEAAGSFDDARLYRGPGLDFAVRDGVLVAAGDINRLQQALARRDGQREFQFNEAPVTALFNELPRPATLRSYSGEGAETEALAGLIATALREGLGMEGSTGEEGSAGADETGAGGVTAEEAAFTLREEAGRLSVEMIVRLAEDSGLAGELEGDGAAADAGEPVPVSITAAALDAALAGLPPESPLRLLGGLAPLAGAAWIDGDSLRARLITPR